MDALELVSFLRLAKRWPTLMQQWQTVESIMSDYCTKKQKKTYIFRIRFVALSFLCLALGNSFNNFILRNLNVFFIVSVEHLIADGSVLHFVLKCHKEQDPMTELAKHNVPHLITYAEHVPLWLAICINFINISSTFVWNFLDIFIMIISKGLSTHFKLLNHELQQASFEVAFMK